MRILHFTYNTTGGAGKVARQLHELFLKNGFDSVLINVEDNIPEKKIRTITTLGRPGRKFINQIRYWLFRSYIRLRYPKKRLYNFTYDFNYRSLRTGELVSQIPFEPDLIFLHWISDFIMPGHIEGLYDYFKCPFIWRYNDFAPATGGCHYTVGCTRFKSGCGKCPALDSRNENDWSRRQWMKKKAVMDKIPMIIINSTKQTEEVFKASPLFSNKRQEFIRNSLDSSVFNNSEKNQVRKELNLPTDRRIIFWGATHIIESRKGFLFFVEALKEYGKTQNKNPMIIIAGNKPESFKADIPFEHLYVGLLDVNQLATYYKSVDLVAVSSLEDGGPMMIVESMMCGTPVVAFATGLGLELVSTGETGYRAIKGDSKDLAKGLAYILNLPPAEYSSLSDRCHEKALVLYGENTEIEAYKKLFADLKK